MRKAIMELVTDASLIPHVYDYCDRWCRYCRITDRCLVYSTERLRESLNPPSNRKPVTEVLNGSLEFSRAVAAATGTPIAKFDVLLSHPQKAPRKGAIGHPLELLGRQYGLLSDAFLDSAGCNYWELPRAPEATPLTVVSWFHWMIPAKIYRALLSAQRAKTNPAFVDDANGSAKLALVAIDRSLAALDEMGKVDADARIDGLREYLMVLSSAVESRFPDARAFVRPGLDADSGQPPA